MWQEKPGKVIWLKETDSTNAELKRLAAAGAPEWAMVIADRQTSGRGRLGRSWYSSGPWGLWVSILLRPRMEPERAPFFGILAAVAVADAIKMATGLDARIKWPNDVEVAGSKVSGILPESGIGPSGLEWLVIGIGINLNEPSEPMPDEIKDRATTLEALCHKKTDRSVLLDMVLDGIRRLYNLYIEEGAENILERAEDLSTVIGKKLNVIGQGEVIEATALGMDEYGALLVEEAPGRTKRLLSGEVSVRRSENGR